MRHIRILALLAVVPAAVGAQTRDTMRLGELQQRAERADPRAAQTELVAAQSRLRGRNLSTERLPTLSLEGQAQHQSDVTTLGITLPGGVRPPSPPYDTYDARVAATQRLYDPTLAPRRALEDAQLAEQRSRVRVALYADRQQVNDVYFAALRAQTQEDELGLALADLDAQLKLATARVREGSALRSEEATLRAEILKRRQTLAEVEANREAALAVLSDLTGVPLDSGSVLEVPELENQVARVRGLQLVQARPEYEQFVRSRETLARQERIRAAQDWPRLAAYGRAGYGKPGLNMLGNDFDTYWLAGLQVQWTPWTWGADRRDREVLALQREIVRTEEEAFTRRMDRALAQDIVAMDRLAATLAMDDEIITLRERIAAETRARYAEEAVTSAEYVDRQSDVVSARLARAAHRVELAQTRAHYLTTLGIEVR